MTDHDVPFPGLEPDVQVVARRLELEIARCDGLDKSLRSEAATVADRRARAIAELVELEGATQRSVAERLEISGSAVAKAVARARALDAEAQEVAPC